MMDTTLVAIYINILFIYFMYQDYKNFNKGLKEKICPQ